MVWFVHQQDLWHDHADECHREESKVYVKGYVCWYLNTRTFLPVCLWHSCPTLSLLNLSHQRTQLRILYSTISEPGYRMCRKHTEIYSFSAPCRRHLSLLPPPTMVLRCLPWHWTKVFHGRVQPFVMTRRSLRKTRQSLWRCSLRLSHQAPSAAIFLSLHNGGWTGACSVADGPSMRFRTVSGERRAGNRSIRRRFHRERSYEVFRVLCVITSLRPRRRFRPECPDQIPGHPSARLALACPPPVPSSLT